MSIDIDAFSSTLAPGCSQSWPLGLNWIQFAPILSELLSSYQLLGVGIYEVAPNWDVQNITSRLAAQIAHSIMQHWIDL